MRLPRDASANHAAASCQSVPRALTRGAQATYVRAPKYNTAGSKRCVLVEVAYVFVWHTLQAEVHSLGVRPCHTRLALWGTDAD